MATVSLLAVGAQLGRTTSGQTVSLGTLRKNGYSRVFSSGAYLRVNPYEVHYYSSADDPERADNLHYLRNWYGYQQVRLPEATVLLATAGYGKTTMTWVGPAGYDKAPLITGWKLYTKTTGYTGSSPGATQLSVEPRTSPSQTQEAGFAASAVQTADINLGSYAGEWVGISLSTKFNDSVTTHEDESSAVASTAGGVLPLIGGDAGVLTRAYNTVPSPINVTQTTLPWTCAVGDNVTIRISVVMEGPSTATLQQQIDSGAWTTLDSSVGAGTTTINRSIASGSSTYKFRIYYNSVSPIEYLTMDGVITPQCNNL